MTYNIGDRFLWIKEAEYAGDTHWITPMVITEYLENNRIILEDSSEGTIRIELPLPTKEDCRQRMYIGYFIPDNIHSLLEEI